MNIGNTARRWLNRMTLDEVLAISPRFMESVETAEVKAVDDLGDAVAEDAEAKRIMEAAALKYKKARRTINAVARVRDISGG